MKSQKKSSQCGWQRTQSKKKNETEWHWIGFVCEMVKKDIQGHEMYPFLKNTESQFFATLNKDGPKVNLCLNSVPVPVFFCQKLKKRQRLEYFLQPFVFYNFKWIPFLWFLLFNKGQRIKKKEHLRLILVRRIANKAKGQIVKKKSIFLKR